MALTKLTDIREPAIWLQYEKDYIPKKFDLINSAALRAPDATVTAQMRAGGRIITMPFWQSIAHTEPKLRSDDETVAITPQKVTTQREQARKIYWTEAIQAARLAGIVATGNVNDPLRAIADYIIMYWRSVLLDATIKVLDGLYAKDVASYSSDMIYSVYSDVASPTAANKISFAAINAARLTMGEMFDGLRLMVMHPKVYFDAVNLELTSLRTMTDMPFKVEQVAGIDVIISEKCTTVAGTNSPKYRTYLLGEGAITAMLDLPEDANEYDRSPELANGGGVDTVFTRRNALIHPYGWRWTETTVAGASPSYAELATAGNWERVRDRKSVNIAYLETN